MNAQFTAMLFVGTYSLTSFAFLTLGVLAYSRGPRTRYINLWVLFCFLVSLFTLFVALSDLVSSDFTGLVMAKSAMTCASTALFVFLCFALCFTGWQRGIRPITLVSASWLAVIVTLFWTTDLVISGVTQSEFSRFAPVAGPLMPLYSLYVVYCWFFPLGLFVQSYRKSIGLRKTQAAYMIAAFVIGCIGSFGTLLPSILKQQTLLAFLPALIMPLFPLTITYAIVRHRLWDVQTIIHKTVVWLVLSVGLVVPIYLVFNRLDMLLADYLTEVDRGFVVFLFFLVGFSYLALAKPRLDHLFQRRSVDRRLHLDQFSRMMAGLERPGPVVHTLLGTLSEALYPEWASALFYREESDTWHALTLPMGSEGTPLTSLTWDDPFIRALVAVGGGAVEQSQVDLDRRFAGVRQEAERFFQLSGAQVCLPLIHRGKILGMVLLDRKKNLSAYSRSDLEFLEQLGTSASTGLSNGLLFEKVDLQRRDLQELSEGLELRVRERTRELRAVNRKLGEANDDLKELDRLKSRFFANISHELRTPLTLILAPLESLLAGDLGPVTEEQVRQYKLIRRNALQLLKLINNLLDLSKLEASRLRLNLEPVHLAELVSGLVEEAQPLADREHIRLMFTSAASPVVMADAEKLERVIVNLLSNALKFTEAGGLVAVVVGETADHAWASVQDSGIGIPAGELPHIFDRFRQVDASSTRRHGGTGIGLSLAKELAELHGGRIVVHSELGRGSTFTVNLHRRPEADVPACAEGPRPEVGSGGGPVGEVDVGSRTSSSSGSWRTGLLAHPDFRFLEIKATSEVTLGAPPDAAQDPDALSSRPEGLPQVEVRAGSSVLDDLSHGDWPDNLKADTPEGKVRPTILVVEDNPDMAGVLERLLASRFRVLTASNGQIGLDMARRELPALVLCDMMMPVMDGVTLCRELRSDRRTAPIPTIMITARTASEDSVLALDAGADDFVSKPFSMRELLARIGAQLRIRQLDQAVARSERMASLGNTAAGLAHEVRNALNPIVNGLEVLESIDDPATQKELMRLMQSSAQRILETVDALQSFVRLGEVPLSVVDLNEALKTTLKLLRHRLNGLSVNLQLDLDRPVQCFPAPINQVFMNLLVNAADAVGKKGQLWITTRRDGESAVVTVRDSGPGIDPKDRERVFLPYFTTKPVGQGTGMGLAISRQIVERHGGTLSVTSSPAQGAELTLVLPLLAPEGVWREEDL